jgi:hypothetical protein
MNDGAVKRLTIKSVVKKPNVSSVEDGKVQTSVHGHLYRNRVDHG